jgi:DNA-binding GntR family transcriptional regulator
MPTAAEIDIRSNIQHHTRVQRHRLIASAKMGTRLAALLRDQIIAGELKAGTPLRLHELAAKFGVSTTPVREALLTLEREGLANGKPHYGLRIAELTRTDIEDVYGLHGYMVRVVTARAAQALSAAHLDELEDINREIAAVTERGDLAGAAELNHDFHRIINRAGSSRMLRRFLSETTPYVSRQTDPLVPGWSEQPLAEHRPILDALRARDGDRAAELMERHIQHSGELVVAFAESLARQSIEPLSAGGEASAR